MSNTTRVSKIDIDQLTAFKNDNENFELQTFDFFAQKKLVGLAQEGAAGITEEQLKGLQRLLDLTQDETAALNLYNAGLDSCFQVAALSQQQFIAQYQAAFGGSSALAAATHQRALARQSQLMHHYLNIKAHHEPHYKALRANNLTNATANSFSGLPSYEDLFGGLDYCQVAPSRAIFSPAAYLVDLIRFKEKQIDDSGVGDEHKLANRRPDLNAIPLDGEHTDTAIPKLEIVNKVLVNKVIKLDSKATSTEDQVYQALTQKIYPFTLPFHWPLTQIRAYLVMLKTDLPTIWRTLDINASSAHLIAQETLAISPQEFTLYTTPKTDKSSIQAAYGLGSSDPLDEDEGLKNIDVFLKKTGLTREALSQLLHGDLSDEEIETGLNKPFFINEGTEPAIDIDKDDKHLTNLTLPRLDRIHRFIRLAKKTGWSFVDLDWVLRLGGNSIEQALPLLAQLKTWQKAYQQPIHILSALIGNIRDCGKAAGQSFFDTIFLQLKTTITLPDRSTQWSIQGDQEANLSIKSLLEGALDISPAVLQAIAAKVGDIMHADETKLPLGLSELSALYRLTLCAQLLKRPVEAVMDLLRWMAPQDNQYTKALIGDSPAVVQTKKAIEALNKLADLSQTLQTGGVSIEALTCILGDPVPLDSPHYLSPDSQKNFIQELYHATQPTLITKSTIQAHPELPQIDKEGNSFDLLAKLKECNAIDNQGIVLKKSLIGSELEQLKEHFYTSEQLAKTLHSFLTKRYKSQQELQKNQPDGQSPLSFSAATLEKTLDQYVNEDLHKINEHAIQSIPDLPKLDKKGANFDLLAKLKEWKIIDDKGIVSTTPEKDKLEEQLKQYFYTSEQLAETLASLLSHHQQLQEQTLASHLAKQFAIAQATIPGIEQLERWTGLSLASADWLKLLQPPSLELPAKITDALQTFNRYACLIKTLSLTQPELQSIIDHPACYNIPDSQHLTLQDIAHLAQYKHLVHTYQDRDHALVAYFAQASSGLDVSTAAQALAKLMQVQEAPLQTLLNHWWSADEATPPAYGTIAGLVRLQQCFELSQQLGLSIASLKALQALADQAGTADANYPAYTQAALNLLSAVKAQYNDTAWTTVYEPIQVTLNEAKRNALADLVSYQSQLDTPRDLYEYLLIDVEVSGVVKTSKIKEAIGCLQLYINRCRMNLEPSIAFYDRADLERNWAWIKNYRVWEANRKTFLYPENYIQPELRQDKTELFQQLTESLQQTHIDPESVTKAVHGYLDRFAEVANLKYAGSYINFFNFNQWGSPSTVSGAQLTNNASTVVFQGKLYCFYHSSSSNNNSIYYSYTTDPSRDSWTEKHLQGTPFHTDAPYISLSTNTSPAVTVFQGKLYCFYHSSNDNSIYYSYTTDPSRDSWKEKQLKVSQGNPKLATGTSPAVTVLQDKLYCFYHGDGDNTIWYSYTSDPSRDSWTEKSLEASQGAPQLATGTSPAVTVLQDKLCCFYHGDGDNTIWYSYTSDPSSNSWTQKQLKAPGNPKLATGTSPAVTVLQDKIYCFYHGLEATTIWYSYTDDPSSDSWTQKHLQDSKGEYPTLAGSPDAVAFNGRLYCFYNYNQELHYNFLYADNATLFLLNRTHTQPYQYYYRQADFTYDASQQTYNNPQWKPWTKINLTIPAQFASPIYAFGKLFVFWAEIKPAPADRNPAGSSGEAGKAKNKRFEATLHYSFYQFNKDWVAPQTVGEAISLPNTVTQAQTEQVVWQRVHVALVGEQLIVRYPQAVSGTRVTQSFQWAIDINLNASSRTDSGGYETTLPLPNDAFNHLPTGTKHYPVSNSNLAILDTGKSAYLGIPQKGSYTLVHEDMTKPPSGELMGKSGWVDEKYKYEAKWLQSEQYVQLTDNKSHHSGILEYGSEYILDNNSFVVDFQFQSGGGTGADAIYFYFFTRKIPYGEDGLHDDDTNETGYLIAYKEYPESSIIIRYKENVLHSFRLDGKLDNATWRKTRIIFNQGKFEIFLDGASIVKYTDRNFLKRDLTGKFWGFGARNGSFNNNHYIRDINVKLPIDQHRYIRLNSTTIHTLSQTLFAQGIAGLLNIKAQLTPEDSFTALGPQAAHVAAPYPAETLDFGGADGLYYWEVFFHTPFLVANQFNTHQQFELAQQWYQYLYNPTIDPKAADPDKDASEAEHYWRFVGLRSSHNPTLKKELQRSPSAELEDELQATAQLRSYHEDPFDPHAIAALRPIAYQKTLVMHYIDNLLDWGDDLFRQDTRETLVEATMHYVTAWDLMGKKPTNLGPCTLPPVQTLRKIREHDGKNIPEFLLDLENQLRALPLPAAVSDNPNNAIANIYFGIPENDQFIAYWERVQGRLYNIRHNLTLDGKPNYLPLFQPPINPMQLIQAIAAGAGVSSALAALQAPVPHYRFTVMLDKAKNATNFVIQLGSALLQALEKKDAEQLALLRTTHEQALLTLTRTSKQDQQKAAEATVEALKNGQAGAQARLDHYSHLLAQGLSAAEKAQFTLEASALAAQGVAQGIKGAAIAGHLIPTVYGFADGDFKPGDAIQQGALIAEGTANMLTQSAGLSATIAQYQRREEDWTLQQTLAQEDISQISSQIQAAQLQVQIAAEELKVLEKNISQTQEIAQFLQTKFSNQDQYLWMVGQLAALYFQAYQLAHQLAVAAQRAWQFEKAHEQSLIQPGYWNDLHKGLLAGEGLMLGLMLLEKAYMDQDARRLEITKTISLRALLGEAAWGEFTDSTGDGSCTFDLDEKLFDHDYPGHYSRQIKTLSLSFPAVLGPYQNIHATLTQTGNKTLLKADKAGVEYLITGKGNRPDNSVLRVDLRANQQIALSQGVNDSGLFELAFQDARYLPFEGTGAVSSWQLAIPPAANPNVLATLTDVIITLHYTALAGDAALQQTIVQEVYKDGSTGQ